MTPRERELFVARRFPVAILDSASRGPTLPPSSPEADMIQGGILGFWAILLPGAVTVLAALCWRALRRKQPLT
jgi:hypothetical protein